ncbi:MAG: hypothetical protein K6E86_07580 [Bacteroidales bacterium]|nr:hypothetical protein [Bacteroidales bacterium]
MKKIFGFILLSLSMGPALLTSCKDDDNGGAAEGTDRQFMTMFITDNTRGKGESYPYNCGLSGAYPHGNTIQLYWYGVYDCAGYQIQMAIQNKVANGADAWAAIQGTSDLLLDTIVGPNVLSLLVKDLQYSTDYRFAIRCLSTQDDNITDFSHASNWYGHGNGRQWQEYMGIKTYDRYETPYVVYVDQSQTTETTMHVCINPNIKTFVAEFTGYNSAVESNINSLTEITEEGIIEAFTKEGKELQDIDKDKLDSYFENFNIASNGQFGFEYLQVKPSPNNPASTVGDKWSYYKITDEDRTKGYIDIDGLTANSVYVIDVIDPNVEVAIDAKYNTCTTRSDGTPGDPILLVHDDLMAQYGDSRADTFALAAEYDAAPISPALYDFISNTKYAEGQAFYLEGGKTYYMDGNDVTCKGFVLATDPADVKEGKRAKVICGIGKNSLYNQATNGEQWNGGPYSMFIFGRQPEAGEGGEIYMKKLAFYDIDFDNPKAFNYGDTQANLGGTSGNYFFNMFSNGMAVTLDSLIIENCTFKRLVRGFIREQGPNYKVWNHVVIRNNQFFDCGYYSNGAGGYPWIAGAGTNNGTNLFKDFHFEENTIFDCPFPSLFCQATDGMQWTAGPWNIYFENNTLVNFNTRAAGCIFNMRALPDGSVYNVNNNLIVLCKQDGDDRVLNQYGGDIRETQTLSDGSAATVTLNFSNNWSTNNNLTNGSIFSANAWTSTSNGFGTLIKNNVATLNGSLEVNVASVSATELFTNPLPPHKAKSASDHNMHRADALDGTATTEYNVNLYFKNFDNEIVTNNVGAARWRSK